MRSWELWEDPDGDHTFFASDNGEARRITEGQGAVKVWETQASSYNAAQRAFHEHMGWEPYQPMLREDGTPYPEDEDDEVRQQTEGAFSSTWSVVCPTTGDSVTLPRNPSDEDLRNGRFEWVCTRCGQHHTLAFRIPGAT